MKNIFAGCLALSVLATQGQAHTLVKSSGFPIGVYAGNPNGNSPSAEVAFEKQFNSFKNMMGGTAPTFMNAFVDFTQSPSAWPSNAGWTAWSWTQSKVVGTAITPVIGIPMSDNAHWQGNAPGYTNDDFFKQIVAGTYDSDYRGVVDSWVHAGFKTLYLRLGWEMNGTYMPWFMGSDSATQADWVAAFQHLAKLLRAEAATDHVTAKIVWNPTDINWTNLPVDAAYPGDASVDVISTDAYSPVYPRDYYNWQLNNGTVDSNVQVWWPTIANRRHFWSISSATQWNPQGTGTGWGMDDSIAFAKQHGKPMSISECGAGGDGVNTGPTDEYVFPYWLANKLADAQAQGVSIAYVNIWDASLGDGDWDFSSAGAGKPREAAAWAAGF